MTRGHVVKLVGILLFAAAMIATPLWSADRFIDARNERRAASAQAVKSAKDAAVAAALKVQANSDRIAVLAEVTGAACRALNVDADRLNAIIDYFHALAIKDNPGPQTEALFAGIPRPVVVKCSPKPRKARP